MASILIVDDKEENLAYLETLLSVQGHEVLIAVNGQQALDIALQQPVDAVISDLLMPVMDGYSLLQNWRQEPALASIPFIVYTATYTEPQDEKLAYSLGADVFLVKPQEPGAFIEHLNAVLGGTVVRPAESDLGPAGDEQETFKLYNQTLVRKLEQRSIQLEEMNIHLQRDIAERERVQAALVASESQLRQLIEAIPQLVWIGDARGQALHANKNWVEYIGLAAEQSGPVWEALVHPDDAARVMEAGQRAHMAGEPFDLTLQLRRADGQYRWMQVHSVPMLDSEGTVTKWIGTATDIDDIKSSQVLAMREEQQQRALAALLEARVAERTQALREANEALEKARHEAEEARKYAEQASNAKSEFLSRMSHELRTPLNAILGFGQLLGISINDPQQQEDIQLILYAGRHLLALVNDILDIARIEAGKLDLQLVEVDVAQITQEAVDMTRPLATVRKVTIGNRIVEPGTCRVIADRKRLTQVLLNLLSNAAKYNHEGGQVLVTCRNSAEAPGAFVRLEVSDTGPGLPEECRDRVFDPFERLTASESQIEGAGIGLSVAKCLVEAMGGSIGVESVSGMGSTFWVELPASSQVSGLTQS